MKKAKMALAAIALFAVVGGGLAFKAAKGTKKLFYTNTTAGICFPITSLTTVTQVAGQATVDVPADPNAFGWYSISDCSGAVVPAYTIAD